MSSLVHTRYDQSSNSVLDPNIGTVFDSRTAQIPGDAAIETSKALNITVAPKLTTAICVASYSKISYTSGGVDITGAGHTVGYIGWNEVNAAGRNVGLAIGIEGKLEVLAGTVVVGVAAENQLTRNTGTVNTLILTDSQVVANSGTIGAVAGLRTFIAQNSGTISGPVIGNWFPDHSGIIPAVARYAHKGDDPGAPIVNKAAIVDQSLFSSTPTTGQSINLPANYSLWLLLPAGTLASLICNFPPAAQAYEGQKVTIKTTQTITTLTLASAGGSFLDPVTTLAANGFVTYAFLFASNIWFRVG